MILLQSFKRLIYQFDMFCSSELLRYRSETQYKTLTGGLFSLAIICVVAVGFASMIADTLQRVTISSSLITQKSSSPPYASLKPSPEDMFMMGFAIQSTDLTFQADFNSGPQYFSVYLTLIQIADGVFKNRTMLPLEQCTREHWSMVPEFNFDVFNANQWLCLPLGVQIALQGAYTSPVSYQAQVDVYHCVNNTVNNNSCAPQEQIDALFERYGNFYMTWNYVNTVINPNQQNFLSYYIEGNDYIIFSSQIGSEAWVYFSDYTVTTDDSIWPFAHTNTSTGCIVEQKAINHPYTVFEGSPFASVVIAKSENSFVYNRQVQKISAVLSYIGGLIGAMTAILFLIKSYTDTSLEVTIGLSLFEISRQGKGMKEQQKEQQDKLKEQKITNKNFNLFGYMRLSLYRILKFFGLIKNSDQQEYLDECQQQAIKQMDIDLLLRRVIKLQTCISRLFTQNQLQQIKSGQPITLKSARKMRTLLIIENKSENNKIQNDCQVQVKQDLNDVVLESESSSSGGFNSESACSMQKDPLSKPKSIKFKIKQQPQRRESFSGLFKTENKVNASQPAIEGDNKLKVFPKSGNLNKIHPENQLPPLIRKGGRFVAQDS